MKDFEKLRQHYKPQKIKVLFIGESIPDGGTFFYNENSNLYNYTMLAFERENIIFSLDKFYELGCWLYDVCDKPVNKLTKKERGEKIQSKIPALFDVIKELKPEFIIVVKKGAMKKITFNEICQKFPTQYIDGKSAFNLPFPACGNQEKYKTELSEIISKIFKQGKEMKRKINSVITLINEGKAMEYVINSNGTGYYNYDERLIQIIIDISCNCNYLIDYELIRDKKIEEYSMRECKTFATWLLNGCRISDSLIAIAIKNDSALKLLQRYL